MKTFCAPAATAFLSLFLVAVALPAQTADAASGSTGMSKVRIVRLSEAKGQVEVDRNTGRGFEAAMTNLPIVERMKLRTADGVAEVEFEDSSTLRLGPNTVIEFPELDRTAAGATVSSVHVLSGTAYVSLMKTQGNEFELLFGQQKLQLPPATHIRLQMDGTEAKLAVFEGTIPIESASGVAEVPHKKTVTFELTDANQPTVAKNITREPLDTWDQDSTEYHARVANVSAFSGSGYSYGLSDMMYYGSFMNTGGCGSMWRPYFVDAGWDPFSNGAWAWYPGAGYSWVSPYPWGWLPYHSGSWAYCPNAGWGWQPGGGWSGLNNTALVTTRAGGTLLRPPSRQPRQGGPSLELVNLRPLVVSNLTAADSFVFRRNSAGLGIPRGSLGKLNGYSRRADERGTASTPVYIQVPRSATANGRPTSLAAAAASIHRGYAMSSAARSYPTGGGTGGEASRGDSGPAYSPGVQHSAASVSPSSAHMGGPSGARGH